MGIETEIENKIDYIHFKLKGEFPGVQILNGFDKLVESSKEFNIKKILLDIRDFDYNLSYLESFNIGEYIAKTYNKYFLKVACLRNLNKKDNFTETVAVNRGAFFRFFNDENKAIDWLKK